MTIFEMLARLSFFFFNQGVSARKSVAILSKEV